MGAYVVCPAEKNYRWCHVFGWDHTGSDQPQGKIALCWLPMRRRSGTTVAQSTSLIDRKFAEHR